MNRAQHLEWAKQRALEYVELGDLRAAYASLSSDLRKHPDTQTDQALWSRIFAGMELLAEGGLDTAEAMRRYVEGFE